MGMGSSTLTPTRRDLVAGVAATAVGGGATAVEASSDPIFAAIARYAAACQAQATCDAAGVDGAEVELLAATDALFETPPTTRAGMLALIGFVIRDAAHSGNLDWCLETLAMAAAFLQRV
jgi:hypothetical protein